jgi:hypothetical protein
MSSFLEDTVNQEFYLTTVWDLLDAVGKKWLMCSQEHSWDLHHDTHVCPPHTRAHMHMRVCTHARARTHTHTHTHAHTHKCMCSLPRSFLWRPEPAQGPDMSSTDLFLFPKFKIIISRGNTKRTLKQRTKFSSKSHMDCWEEWNVSGNILVQEGAFWNILWSVWCCIPCENFFNSLV